MNREQMIATLTLMGWQPQMSILFNVERGLHIGRCGLKVKRIDSMRPFIATDGWNNFATEDIRDMLTKVLEYDHEP